METLRDRSVVLASTFILALGDGCWTFFLGSVCEIAQSKIEVRRNHWLGLIYLDVCFQTILWSSPRNWDIKFRSYCCNACVSVRLDFLWFLPTVKTTMAPWCHGLWCQDIMVLVLSTPVYLWFACVEWRWPSFIPSHDTRSCSNGSLPWVENYSSIFFYRWDCRWFHHLIVTVLCVQLRQYCLFILSLPWFQASCDINLDIEVVSGWVSAWENIWFVLRVLVQFGRKFVLTWDSECKRLLHDFSLLIPWN